LGHLFLLVLILEESVPYVWDYPASFTLADREAVALRHRHAPELVIDMHRNR
jgi:hypothetical protein